MTMGSILMIYASQTGNTERATEILQEQLEELEHDVMVESFGFDDIMVEDLEQYDAVLIGTYTWGDGDLPFEAEDFYIDMEGFDLSESLIGVYGTGDSFFETFGIAVESMWERAEESGAMMVDEPLIIDLDPDEEDEERLQAFAEKISEKIEENIKM